MTKELKSILDKINHCAHEFNREPNSVSLLAVSKTQSIEKIKAVYDQGQKRFGENYLQEALTKIEALKDLDIEWHFIGQIQSNKTKQIAEHFSWVQSVSSLKVAERLNAQRPTQLPPLNVCVQVNTSEEVSKGGVSPDKLIPLVKSFTLFKCLKFRGIMVIPRVETDYGAQLEAFKLAYSLFEQLQKQGFNVDTLSMGMSGDFKAAIAAGSTQVRIGSALFGLRA